MDTQATLAERLWQEIINSSFDDWTVKVAALVIATLLAPYVGRLIAWIWRSLAKLGAAQRRLNRAFGAISHTDGLWLPSTIPISRTPEYEKSLRTSIPIICFANLKGGVGKTTTAANLAAYFGIERSERILLIDLDYQGSLTAIALGEERAADLMGHSQLGRGCRAAQLCERQSGDWINLAAIGLADRGLPNAKLIPADDTLAQAENRLLLRWLLNDVSEDIRYSIFHSLHSDEVQTSFDKIIIDAPPRLTTSAIQALCASTHVVIPTVLDQLSAMAVGNFAAQLRAHQELWPRLQVLGGLGTMISHNPLTSESPLTPTEVDAYSAAEDFLTKALVKANRPLDKTSMFPVECCIPDRAEIGRQAGYRFAYRSGGGAQAELVRKAFNTLGDEVTERLRASRLSR